MSFGEYKIEDGLLKRLEEVKGSNRLIKTREDFVLLTASRDFWEFELQWCNCGKPYFKVPGALAHILMDTDLDIPVEYLKLPFKSFLLRLDSESNFTIWGSRLVSILFGEFNGRISAAGYLENGRKPSFAFSFSSKGTVEEAIREAHRANSTFINTDISSCELCLDSNAINFTEDMKLVFRIFRLFVSVCFLATGRDRLVEREVLNADQEKFDASTDEAQKEKLVSRAIRQGKNGFILGRRIPAEILLPSHHKEEKNEFPGVGKPRTFQHQRRAHFRVYDKDTNPRVVFVMQHTVRPDLPLPPDTYRRGYKLQN